VDPIYDFAEHLQHVRRQLIGAEPPGIPTGYLHQPEDGRPYWSGTGVPVIGASTFAPTSSGLLVPTAVATGPAPIDAMVVYLAADDILGRPLAAAEVASALAAASALDFIELAAHLLGRLEAQGSLNLDFQRTVAAELFAQPMLARVHNAISNGRHLLAPQVLLAVMKVALLQASSDRPSTRFQDGFGPFLTVMLGVAQALGAEPPAATGTWGDFPEWLSLELVRNQVFNAESNAGSILARYQRLWRELPAELAGLPDAVDVEAAFKQATGIGMDELLAVGFPLLAETGKGIVRRGSAYFDTSDLPADRRDAALRLLAVDLDQMRSLVQTETEAGGFDWAFTTFRRFPLLRTLNGDLIVLSGKLLLERIAGGAAFWELDNYFRLQGERAFFQFRSFHGRVVERHVRDGVEAIAAALPTGERRVWYEENQREAWGPEGKACDILIDYGWAWVCVEVVSSRLTQKSIAQGTGVDFDRDVDRLVEDKLKQLDASIRNLREREATLTGRPPMSSKRFFPIVLAGYGFPANPMTMSVIQQRTAAAGLLQGPDVGAVEVLDFDTLEQVEGAAQEGGPTLADLLADKQTASLRLASLDQYMHFERTNLALRRPERINVHLETMFRRVMELHGFDGEAEKRPAQVADGRVAVGRKAT
jgi:hypothetical protein